MRETARTRKSGRLLRCHPHHHQITLPATCTMRPGAEPAIDPKEEEFTSVLGTPRLVWLSALKASPRSWNLTPSKMVKFLNRDKSHCVRCGASRILRPDVPKTPGAG